MTLPTVETARASMLDAVRPLAIETVSILEADGRWLAEPVRALRDQPPFDVSSMDGWAVSAADARPGGRLSVSGESAAGGDSGAPLGWGHARRIFTGAGLPAGADRVVIQEQAEQDGDDVRLSDSLEAADHVRRRGSDFRSGDILLEAGRRLTPWRLALAAASGRGSLICGRRPRVALQPTGDEIAPIGKTPKEHQIHDAVTPALVAFVRRLGGEPQAFNPVIDEDGALVSAMAGAAFDLLITVGGASVGDHDRLRPTLRRLGARMIVEGVAVRPGKPVWFAALPDGRPVLGLPGNPASALVCAELFAAPIIERLQGGNGEVVRSAAALGAPLPANGPRDHYMRARLEVDPDGLRRVSPLSDQDSGRVSVMAAADCLLRRPPLAPVAQAGDGVEILETTGCR